MRLLVALLAVCTLATPVPAAPSDATVALNFQDVDLPVLARFVSEVTGRNFILDDRVRGSVTIISPTRITPEEAYLVFQSVLQVKGFTTVPSGNFVKIVPVREGRESAIPTGVRAGDELVTRILPLRYADVTAVVPAVQSLVSKDGVLAPYAPTNRLVVVDSASNVDRIAAVIRDLDVPTGSDRITESVPLHFAPADELAGRLRQALSSETPKGNALRVVPETRTNSLLLDGSPADVARARSLVARLDVSMPGASQLHVYRLRYAQAESLVRVISQLLGLPPPPPTPPKERGSLIMRSSLRDEAAQVPLGYNGSMGEPPAAVAPPPPQPPPPVSTGTGAAIPLEAPVRITADPATNTLVVSATPADWNTLHGVIADLDVRRRQVFVEAIILEASTDKLRSLGIELQGVGSLGGSTVGFGQVNLSALGTAVSNPTSLPGLILAAASNKTVTLPNGQQVPAYTLLLTALETQSDVNVLSAPNMVTTDNEEAEIVVGRNVPFLASRATSASNLSNLFTTIERRDVGITLRLTPRITADDFVHLSIFEEVSDIDPIPNPAIGDPNQVGPTTTIRSASTVVGARDRQTIVIGGLLADTVRLDERGVPFLKDVPVLGNLFKRDDNRRVKTNLLVFLTPHVIATDQQMADNSLREREHMPPRVRRSPLLRGRSWEPPGTEAPHG
jgi:general secretion pathway protein D